MPDNIPHHPAISPGGRQVKSALNPPFGGLRPASEEGAALGTVHGRNDAPPQADLVRKQKRRPLYREEEAAPRPPRTQCWGCIGSLSPNFRSVAFSFFRVQKFLNVNRKNKI